MATAQVTPTQPTVVAGQSSALTPHTVLVCQNLEKYYGTRGNITKALDGINLSVARGEFIAIMGPSGSGKTTLLNCISTIDQASAGHIFIDDQELSSLRGAELSAFRRDRLGFIFQDANLLDSLTAHYQVKQYTLDTSPYGVKNTIEVYNVFSPYYGTNKGIDYIILFSVLPDLSSKSNWEEIDLKKIKNNLF